MNKKVKAAWIKALRSGDYTQGRGVLRSMDDEFCCLGVLADVKGARWSRCESDERYELRAKIHLFVTGSTTEPSYGALTTKFREQFGLTEEQQSELILMNDRGVPFPDIANHIEKNF